MISSLEKLPNRGRPFAMLALLATLLTMIASTLVALGTVNQKYNQYSAPGLHTEVWQSYQLHSELRRLIETAERTMTDEVQPVTLLQRIGVVQSLLQPLQHSPVYHYLDEPQPEVTATLSTLERLTQEWAGQLDWQDLSRADDVAEDISSHLPSLLAPAHRIVVASNVAVVNQLNSERRDLRNTFLWLAGALLILGLGCIPLVLKLIRDHVSTRRLTQELGQLNQTLERRVEERTQRLNERKALLGAILDSSPSDVALLGANDGHVYYVSSALRRLSPDPDAFNMETLFVDPPQYDLFQRRLASRQPVENWEVQLGPQTPYWAQLSVRYLQLESQPACLIWSLDITERKRMENELKRLASLDSLTGLANRRTFLRQSIKQLRRAQRDGKPCSALAIDIDFFKRINDEHGHQVGDIILQAIAQRLQHHLGDAGVLGRLGGEEFAALLPGAEAHEAWGRAESMRQDIADMRHQTERGDTLMVTVSIGIATQYEEASPKHLLIRADEALYRAKASGRNRSEHNVPRGFAPPAA